MLFTTGDVFWSLATAGLALIFWGLARLVGERTGRTRLVAAWAAMGAGLAAIVVPAFLGIPPLA